MEYDKYNEFTENFARNLNTIFNERSFSDIVFLCVGTDRITGDSYGPLVGYKLKELYKEDNNIHIYGDLEEPISINNIDEIMEQIEERYNLPFVIAIDSAISNKENIGKIVISKRRIQLGSGLRKKSIKVGDISIKGIVSEDLRNSKNNFILLQNTPLSLVMDMADKTAKGIYDVMNIN